MYLLARIKFLISFVIPCQMRACVCVYSVYTTWFYLFIIVIVHDCACTSKSTANSGTFATDRLP